MPRLTPLDAADAPPKAAAEMAKLPKLNIFGIMAHGDRLLPEFSKFGGYLLNRTKLDPILREIAIIRVGILSKAKYEVHQHDQIGRQLGMSEPLIQACREGAGSAALDATQRLVMAFTDDVVAHVRASDATYDPLAKVLSAQEMQELVMVIGFYMTVSRFLENFDVEIEETGPPADQLPGLQPRR